MNKDKICHHEWIQNWYGWGELVNDANCRPSLLIHCGIYNFWVDRVQSQWVDPLIINKVIFGGRYVVIQALTFRHCTLKKLVWHHLTFESRRFLKACFKVAFLYAVCRQLYSEHFHPLGSFLPGLQSLFTLLIYANTDMYVNLLCITVYSEIINRLFCHLNNKLIMMFIFLILCTLHIYGTV